METEQELEDCITANRAEFGADYEVMNWISPDQAAAAAEQRRELLAGLQGKVQSCCHGAKLYTGSLAPGCRLCTEGAWSCLFINGICNGRCFYCPTAQAGKGEPTTNTLQFPAVRDYTDYLKAFLFRGAGISGGEPLLTLDRTLQYIEKIRKKFGADMHVWMYTNGMLLDADKLKRLRNAGLNEIRFDISADQYSLDKVGLAVGVIPCVTIEIPAIPEDAALLRDRLRQMSDLGVNHLNLHQLRCTVHNRPRLAARPYTFLHGPKVTVLESEQAALEMLRFAADEELAVAVNYCSFIYRHRYQGMGSRRRAAGVVRKPHEEITEAGYIRSLAVGGEPAQLAALAEVFREKDQGRELWSLNSRKDRLACVPGLLALADQDRFTFHATYSTAALRHAVSYLNPYREIRLDHGRKIIAERRQVSDELLLAPATVQYILAMRDAGPDSTPAGAASHAPCPREVLRWEHPGSGLAAYF